jgi:hypothetical protein
MKARKSARSSVVAFFHSCFRIASGMAAAAAIFLDDAYDVALLGILTEFCRI